MLLYSSQSARKTAWYAEDGILLVEHNRWITLTYLQKSYIILHPSVFPTPLIIPSLPTIILPSLLLHPPHPTYPLPQIIHPILLISRLNPTLVIPYLAFSLSLQLSNIWSSAYFFNIFLHLLVYHYTNLIFHSSNTALFHTHSVSVS
jgi:hypothetical protein